MVKQPPVYSLARVYRSWAHGAAIASDIRNQGGVAAYRALEVTSLEDMQAFVDFAKDKFGRIDVIVNNAGLMPLSKLKVDE